MSLADVGLSADALDRQADPCADFYQFACGGWLARTEIPADKSRWSRGFSEIDRRNEEALHRILEKAAQTPGDKLGDFYAACMDEAGIEKAGAAPLRPWLDRIARIRNRQDVAAVVTELHRHGVWALFDISAEQDYKDATRVIAYLDQNGLGLPDRDYYTNHDDKSRELRRKYEAHVERMLVLAGFSPNDAKKAVRDVLHIEEELAHFSKTKVERRDPAGLYNKIDRAGIEALVPFFPWKDYFAALGVADLKDINVTSTRFFEGVNRLLVKIKPASWRNYLAWHVVRAAAPMLSKAFVDESFAMAQALTGQKELEARWKRCIDATDRALGDLLAQPYLAEHFTPEAKQVTEKLIGAIGQAFVAGLEQLDWMDAQTKARAKEKYARMVYKIGYPDRWKTYDFPVDRNNHAANVFAARAWDQRRILAKIGKPVDRTEWFMTVPTVNAYANPLMNEMVFPAGILQPPFFNPRANVPVNLGGLGMIVGHELTHHFDDEGSKFAADGNLAEWWEPATRKHFEEKTQCVADQYAQYEALPGVPLNGKLTLGENIADIGGVKYAFRAYRQLRRDASEVAVADGFTEDQQFFLGFAQAWCGLSRDEVARMLAQIDPHSPPKWRVNGSLANLPEFAEAFHCAPGTPMRRENACTVW